MVSTIAIIIHFNGLHLTPSSGELQAPRGLFAAARHGFCRACPARCAARCRSAAVGQIFVEKNLPFSNCLFNINDSI